MKSQTSFLMSVFSLSNSSLKGNQEEEEEEEEEEDRATD
jgi:hypothetical protein